MENRETHWVLMNTVSGLFHNGSAPRTSSIAEARAYSTRDNAAVTIENMLAPSEWAILEVFPAPVEANAAEAKYEKAMTDFRAVSRAYDIAAHEYRACKISDETYLAARKALDSASTAVNNAEDALDPLPRLSSWNEGD